MTQRQITPIEFECMAYIMFAACDYEANSDTVFVHSDWFGPGASDEDEANYNATHRHSRNGY